MTSLQTNNQLTKDTCHASFSYYEETSHLICYVGINEEEKHVSLAISVCRVSVCTVQLLTSGCVLSEDCNGAAFKGD